MSADLGDKIYVLSNDHKPTDEQELKRIIDNGGKVYQTQTTVKKHHKLKSKADDSAPQVLLGPPRVKPGRLSVSRTFGDIEAKHPKYGGNPGVVIAVPEVVQFTIDSQCDFIVIG